MRVLEKNHRPPPKSTVRTKGQEIIASGPVVTDTELAAADPAAVHITKLLDQVASESGLERKEIMRRAQRKRRALGPVTLWMVLLLVAREQHLEMQKFIETISF